MPSCVAQIDISKPFKTSHARDLAEKTNFFDIRISISFDEDKTKSILFGSCRDEKSKKIYIRREP